ncbi:MAG: ABC transporter ATP-binding protein, partial [Nitrospirales bacterium]
MVRLVQVCKAYQRVGGRVQALQDVTLHVSRGEFCAVMGPSGCGKSTLLNLIAGLDVPTSGEISIAGRSTQRFTDAEWTTLRRVDVGMVFQAFHLIPGLTVRENVALPLLFRGEGGRTLRVRVEESLAAVGLEERADHRPGELSGGEQQRAAIARELVHQPKLVLADEPTGNLDSQNGEEIVKLLRTLHGQFGHTVIVVTHSRHVAAQADRIQHMRDGRLD